jgi:Sulfotransferase domain
MTVRIAMWSGPRNISTAMMRSFSSRDDCAVSDEPFYGAYLKYSGERQAMADAVIASMDCEWASIAAAMRGAAPGGKPVWYQKHMPHHMVGPVDCDDFPDHAHAFLIRAPALVVASYIRKNDLHDAAQLGFARMVDYHKRVSDRIGSPAPIVDSDDILANPAAVLETLCAALGIAWQPAMLQWRQGQYLTDGIWAAHWYQAVEASTGFGQPAQPVPLPPAAQRIADLCQADYDYLHALRLGG